MQEAQIDVIVVVILHIKSDQVRVIVKRIKELRERKKQETPRETHETGAHRKYSEMLEVANRMDGCRNEIADHHYLWCKKRKILQL